jgi:type IV pilus assembly protein PilE
MKVQRGFTLIELMVTLVIVAILASIAIPSYREYVLRGNRRAAQAAMMELATRQHQFFAANREFADETVAAFALPPEIADKYTLDIDLDAGPPPAFTIELAPKSGSPMEGDVTLTLNSDGVKTPAGKW